MNAAAVDSKNQFVSTIQPMPMAVAKKPLPSMGKMIGMQSSSQMKAKTGTPVMEMPASPREKHWSSRIFFQGIRIL
ncbi:MAG: hypothetical protein ACE5E9_14940 [Nitrospinaceae bacterium]